MANEKPYSKKDIFNMLRQVKQEIIENNDSYSGINKHIYKKATEDSVYWFDYYLELDKDSPMDRIKEYGKQSMFSQLEYIRTCIWHLKKEYTGENKDTYEQCINDVVKICEHYMEIYQSSSKWRRLK